MDAFLSDRNNTVEFSIKKPTLSAYRAKWLMRIALPAAASKQTKNIFEEAKRSSL
ncbi:hypothetical protein [Nitrosomonas oligotropha]|uniref:hypothetical protein n=1 Tax=Nitrosomonas oligotropha TaxID=42354 RepID=UPI0015A0E5A7|nr:hypothetical protein [Nitrosomonas oligotropha]